MVQGFHSIRLMDSPLCYRMQQAVDGVDGYVRVKGRGTGVGVNDKMASADDGPRQAVM